MTPPLSWAGCQEHGGGHPIDHNLFYRFGADHYEKTSTILTSSTAFSDWTELFHDQVIVTAILDRLLHHSPVINIRDNSYRLKGKLQKEGEKTYEQKQ
ncbi:MAG TPA: ATP-binding protein [Sedimentisphaerales bacterium]|nr:ATP-binding protein [Sedimentisphaerales bacterium]